MSGSIAIYCTFKMKFLKNNSVRDEIVLKNRLFIYSTVYKEHYNFSLKMKNCGKYYGCLPLIKEGISGAGVHIWRESSRAGFHKNTKRHVVVLPHRGLDTDHVSQVILITGPLIHPIICETRSDSVDMLKNDKVIEEEDRCGTNRSSGSE